MVFVSKLRAEFLPYTNHCIKHAPAVDGQCDVLCRPPLFTPSATESGMQRRPLLLPVRLGRRTIRA